MREHHVSRVAGAAVTFAASIFMLIAVLPDRYSAAVTIGAALLLITARSAAEGRLQ